MKAAIISPSTQNTLSPLLCNRELRSLPIMGEPIINHIHYFLLTHGIEEADIYEISPKSAAASLEADIDGVIAIEMNLLTDTNLTKVIKSHRSSSADITAVVRRFTNSHCGQCVQIGKNNMITSVSDSSYTSSPSAFIPEGIFIISPNAAHCFSDVSHEICGTDIIKTALKNELQIMGYISDRSAVSVTSIENYRKCHTQILEGTLPAHLRAVQVKEGFWMEPGADLESGVKIETPVYISSGCHIERGAKIGNGTLLGSGCTVRANSSISHAVIGEGCNIAERASIDGGILSDNVSIGHDSVVMENAAIGSGCRIENDCTVKTSVKVWPNKRIMEGTRLNDNLVWGSVGTEHIFRNGKICGEINVDITPEFMAKLGAALGTMYHGAKIGLGYDSAPVCSMLASALSAGLTSSGAVLFVFGEQTLPMTRCAVRYYNPAIGIHINQASTDGTFYPEIEFIENNGASFRAETEQKLETTFFNDVFLRPDAKNLKEAVNLSGYRFSYVQDILNSLKSTHFLKNMEVRTRSETISEILELLLSETELLSAENTAKEFSVDIETNGQKITLYNSFGEALDNNQLLAVTVIVMLEHLNCRKVVLPVSAPTELEEIIRQNGAEVIHCGASDTELMHTILANNLCSQFRMCFDGVYFAITLLDYLNSRQISFNSLISSIPSCILRETEVECPNSRKNEIIEHLYSRYSENKIDMTDGIKIYQSNGWVLVIPEKYRHYIRIITEGTNMEAAEEISNIFTNQIKKLAKPQ